MFAQNLATLNSHGLDAELLLVNDSPRTSIEIPVEYADLPIRIHVNEHNLGIHAARVAGIEHAGGDYILLLDQDDSIADNYLWSQYEHIGDRDVVVCNGVKELNDYNKTIYKDGLKFRLVNHPLIYLCAANQIVSPGQCLLRKSQIPSAWLQYPLQNNGSDDLFLWLLYLSQKQKFAINNERLYRHRQVGDNLSNDIQKMCISDDEMCDVALKNELLPARWMKYRRRMRAFIADSGYTQKITIRGMLKYPDIIAIKVFAYVL